MKLKKGGIYEISRSIHDFDDPYSSYIIKVNSDLIGYYYRVTIISTYCFDTKICLEEWENVRELSSLEKELL